jgi:hypothetical protein
MATKQQRNNQQEGWPTVGKRARAGGEGRTPAYTVRPPNHSLTVIMENTDLSLVTQGWVGEKPCLVTVDTGAYVTVVRPDIAAGWPERQPNQRFLLQTVSGEALPILKEVFLTLTLGRRRGFCRGYHQRVHLGTGHTARL